MPMIRGEFRVAFAFWVAFAAASTPCGARDLSLTDAEGLLAAHNRELRAARRTVESAEAQQLIAGARPNATFSVNATSINSANTIKDQRRSADTIFRIDQPFERGGKRELRLEAASSLQRAAQNDSLDVLRQQLAAVRGAYFDLKQAQERVRVLGESAQLSSGTLSAAQARLKAGDLAPADVAKVQVDYERAQNDARSAQGDLVRAQLALAYMIGAEARLEAAEKLRDLARATRTRDITVGAQYERWIPGGIPTNAVGVGISVPLFTGYDFSGDIQKAEVDRYATLDVLAKTRAVASIEVRRAASDLNAAAERLERYETSLLGAAGRSAQAAEFAFLRGATSVLEVLDARRTLRAVQLESVTARADYAKALAAWRASLSTAEQMGGK